MADRQHRVFIAWSKLWSTSSVPSKVRKMRNLKRNSTFLIKLWN